MAAPASPARRRIIAGVGAAASGAAGLAWWHYHDDGGTPAVPDAAFPNPLRLPGTDGLFGIFDVAGAFTISAKPVQQAIMPDKPTTLLAYEVEYQGNRLYNPLIRLRSNGKIHAKYWNGLEETSIIHWHGLIVDSNNDGHPHYAVGAGETFDYSFAVPNRAATYWYHPHPHHLTGKQVYRGLGGLFIVEDEEELALQQALDLQLGITDIPLVLHDRRLSVQGDLEFAPDGHDEMHGFLGAQVLVNWTPGPYFEATSRVYRFRILNASNARIYKLAFRTMTPEGEQLLPYQVIGNDGGLLERPQTVTQAYLSPAERIDILLDLRKAKVGSVITLASLAFDPMEQESGVAVSGSAAPPADVRAAHHQHSPHAAHAAAAPATAQPGARPVQGGIPGIGTGLDLMRILVQRAQRYDHVLPTKLSTIVPIAATCQSPRVIVLDHANGIWRINGETYRHESTPLTVQKGATEVWNIRNAAASMPHPFHIHGFQFQVLERQGSPAQQSALALNDKGLAASDLGWKDTVLVWPGETVCIALDFTHPFGGDQVYMIHCHNLEHEDQGMMLNLKVEA